MSARTGKFNYLPAAMQQVIAKSLWHLDQDRSAVREEVVSARGDQLLVRAQYSLISLGTERLISGARVPEALHQQMQVPYMAGNFLLPVKYGYSLVGRVHEPGAPIHQNLVHLMHPHQSMCCVSPDSLTEIPPDVPARRATLASNLETALNAVWDSEVGIGDRTLVVGFGLIGSLVARLLQLMPAVDVAIVEHDANRKAIALEMGFTVHEDGAPYDVAFHTSASQEGLQKCIDSVGLEGRIVELSWYGDCTVELQLGGEFHAMRKQIVSSQVARIKSDRQSRWDLRRRKEVVFELLKNPVFDSHITHHVSLTEAAELFIRWRTQPPAGLSYCIHYD